MKPLPWLSPLCPVYDALLKVKNAAYDHGLLRTQQLQSPVISVGNLSTGGAGKTPFVIELARLLTAASIAVDVLSRGYGRASDATERVQPESADAIRYGDEPLMIANATGLPVFVGHSRYEAGVLAEKNLALVRRVHLLDDSFQHRQLARDIDIVLLHRSDLTARLLPAGNLREPLSSLQRARFAVLREEDSDLAPTIQQHLGPVAEVCLVRRTLTCDKPSGGVIAFCGIARPGEFFSGLRTLGLDLAETMAYPDHHRFTYADLDRLLEQCRRNGASSLVTTEKDAARLGADGRAMLEAAVPLLVAKLLVTLLDSDKVVTAVARLLD